MLESRKHKFTLFVGPYPPPMHGQAFAFKVAYDHYPLNKILISQNLENKNKWYKVFLTIQVILKYIRCFIVHDIDVVYLAGSRSFLGAIKDIVLILISKVNKSKLINHVHAAHFNTFIQKLPFGIRSLYLWVYRMVDHYIVLHPSMLKEYEMFNSKSQIHVIENFYDKLFDSQLDLEMSKRTPITISYFSNLLYSKGLFDLIEAFLKIRSLQNNIKLQIAGAFGNDSFMNSDQVKILLDEYLSKNLNIVYCGSLFGAEKINFLNQSDIFVLPSFYHSEAFPISLLEAMRAGNALILSDHHYLPDLINKNQGIIVESRNVEQITKALDSLISNPEHLLNIRRYNREMARSYTEGSYCEKINKLIRVSMN